MNELDTKIRQALRAATELPDSIPEPSLTEEILETFHGRHSFLNISGAIKMVVAGLIFYFCIYQFFQQDSMMALIAYATAALICMLAACTTMLWLWVQMNHNTTVREIKRLELQLNLLTQELKHQRDPLQEKE